MTRDPYAICSCGSGKKFRWCCQPIDAEVRRAFDQEAQGQHETALRLLNELVAANQGNPEVHGQLARLLYAQGKAEEAEAALQKAFDINPNYPFGLLLRAVFRFQEGELPGALLLARRAAEHYHPEARDYLAEAYSIIFECEMKLNRPVAARAALSQVVQNRPADQEARESFEALFGEKSRLPLAARRDYRPLPLPPGVSADAGPTPRLHEVARAYERVTQEHPEVAAGWFNLGLSRACLGDNRGAVEALDRYIDLETNEKSAAAAAALGEVLRCGEGMEDEADYHEYALLYQIRDAGPVNQLLRDWMDGRRMIPLQTGQEGTLAAILLELTTAQLLTVGGPPADSGRMAGYLFIAGPIFQITSPNKESFDRLKEEVRQRLTLSLGDLHERRMPAQFQNVVADALLFPAPGAALDTSAADKVRDHAAKYYEEVWVHKPRRSLAGNTPLDAAGLPRLRRRLLGVIQFIEECAKDGFIATYDFNHLRRKLGLLEAPSGPAPAAEGGPTNIPAMGAAELAALKADALTVEQLEQAYQTAQKLDAEELTAHFARALVSRPPAPDRPDRFPFYSYLTQHAVKTGATQEALDLVNEGEKADCEHNEGRRRNDYELRRGQVHVKRGEAEAAADVFQRLIDRAPTNLKYRGSAAEAMLSLKQGARALRFAEEGLVAARQQNDRDSEHYLLELVAAAKKQGG
jgi:tetratricopeptide (TPR) repeat protein